MGMMLAAIVFTVSSAQAGVIIDTNSYVEIDTLDASGKQTITDYLTGVPQANVLNLSGSSSGTADYSLTQ